jgi:hypothetical protein
MKRKRKMRKRKLNRMKRSKFMRLVRKYLILSLERRMMI